VVGGQGGAGGTGAALPSDFREPGPHAVATSEGSYTTGSGCELAYDRYEPEGASWPGAVVVLHGLECGRQHVADWARHYASWGLRAVAPDLCHATLTDMDQEQNGLDAAELAASVSSGPTAYVGHSAGGLSSLVAAAHDPGTVASFGLDAAEWNGIGMAAAQELSSPVYGLVGIPVSCNGFNNILPVYAALAGSRALRVVEADHCDFSSPNSCTSCQLGCGIGTNLLFTDAEIATTVRALSVAFLAWQTEVDPSGQAWWEPGQEPYDTLVGLGAIVAP
jgi:dienelactone hydrolase